CEKCPAARCSLISDPPSPFLWFGSDEGHQWWIVGVCKAFSPALNLYLESTFRAFFSNKDVITVDLCVKKENKNLDSLNIIMRVVWSIMFLASLCCQVKPIRTQSSDIKVSEQPSCLN
uniref:Uncharacterized protein n=1 Tax=Oryzias sinensis TaxID=183150 RepID=A0A8C7Z9G4_9TELE